MLVWSDSRSTIVMQLEGSTQGKDIKVNMDMGVGAREEEKKGEVTVALAVASAVTTSNL